jgi:hypothetical protein
MVSMRLVSTLVKLPRHSEQVMFYHLPILLQACLRYNRELL